MDSECSGHKGVSTDPRFLGTREASDGARNAPDRKVSERSQKGLRKVSERSQKGLIIYYKSLYRNLKRITEYFIYSPKIKFLQ